MNYGNSSPLHLDIDTGAGESRLLEAIESDLAPDAAFDAVSGDDHLRKDFLRTGLGDRAVAVSFSENDADHSPVALDFAYEFGAGASFNLGPVVSRELRKPRVKNFTVQHDARARLRNFDVHAVWAVNVKAVDDAFDTAFVNRTVSLQVGECGTCLAATYRETDAFALLEEQHLVPRPCEVPGRNGSTGASANHHDIILGIKHRSPPKASAHRRGTP